MIRNHAFYLRWEQIYVKFVTSSISNNTFFLWSRMPCLKNKTPKRNFTIVLLVPTLTHLLTILSSISIASTLIQAGINSRSVLSSARMVRKFNQWTKSRWKMWCASVESKNPINGATGVRAQVNMILAMNERIVKFFYLVA